jgi:hypothetical protein
MIKSAAIRTCQRNVTQKNAVLITDDGIKETHVSDCVFFSFQLAKINDFGARV